MQKNGLDVMIVNGSPQTDAVHFPPARIDHTRLSVPKNSVKTVEFDCDSVKMEIHASGHTHVYITRKEGDGSIVTEITLSPMTEYVLSQKVFTSSEQTPPT